jgi:hypothetical protein
MKIILGDRFGRLIVQSFEGRNKQYDSLWRVICDCGNKFIVRGGVLKNGHTKSCGCLQRERTGESHIVHGLYFDPITGKRSKLYRVWMGMKERCSNNKNEMFKYYGGSGIIVCEEWANDYSSFYRWAMEGGYKEGLTIERINGCSNYEPSNCMWIPQSLQSRNRRNNKILTLNGVTKKVVDWAIIVNIPGYLINYRIRLGWSTERALTQKPR